MVILHIKELMEEKGLTPRDIEPYMNISCRTIYRIYENRRIPNLEDMLCFAKILGVKVDDLYTYIEDETSNPPKK